MKNILPLSPSSVVLYLSLGLFLISLTQPAFYIDRSDYDAWSSPIGLLLVGWLPILGGEWSSLPWLANPLIFLSWILIQKNQKAFLWTGLLAVLLAVSFLGVDEIMSSEAPTYSKITAYKAGYWLWLASMVCFLGGAIYLQLQNLRSHNLKTDQA